MCVCVCVCVCKCVCVCVCMCAFVFELLGYMPSSLSCLFCVLSVRMRFGACFMYWRWSVV